MLDRVLSAPYTAPARTTVGQVGSVIGFSSQNVFYQVKDFFFLASDFLVFYTMVDVGFEAELFFLAASFLTGVNLTSSMASISTRSLPISIGSELGLLVLMVRVGLPCQQFRFRHSPLSFALGWQLSVSPGI